MSRRNTVRLNPDNPTDQDDAAAQDDTVGATSGRVAFQHPDFRYYWFARICGVLAIDMQITAVGWQVYNLTGKPLALGLVGLVQILPFFLLFPLAGMAADRFPRKYIMATCVSVQALCAVVFFILTVTDTITFPLMLVVLSVLGLARSFQSPAQQAIVPTLVPRSHFPNAVAWTSASNQPARITGPGIAGLLIIAGEQWVYGIVVILILMATVLTLRIQANTQIMSQEPLNLRTVFAGFRFIAGRQVILGAITVDLFAVLLGGATALLPIYAKDILLVGPVGFGILRAMHMLGSFTGALYFTQRPLARYAGIKMFATVGVFGSAIIVFGLSPYFWLSLAALFVLGASDSVSVFIRANLVQLITPDAMRGRVNAVNSVFIGASNELGEFESGMTAAWWGVVPAVVVGGIGTVVVAAICAAAFPQLRGVDRLDPRELIRKYQ